MASAGAGIRLSDSVSLDVIARMFPIEEILGRSYRLLPTKILALDEGPVARLIGAVASRAILIALAPALTSGLALIFQSSPIR